VFLRSHIGYLKWILHFTFPTTTISTAEAAQAAERRSARQFFAGLPMGLIEKQSLGLAQVLQQLNSWRRQHRDRHDTLVPPVAQPVSQGRIGSIGHSTLRFCGDNDWTRRATPGKVSARS
jgi:hypothetical protein